MSDQLWRAEWKSKHLRVTLVECSQLTQLLAKNHRTHGWMSNLYSKALCAGLLTSPLLVEDERYTLRWQYEGELGTITIDVGSKGHIRGFPAHIYIKANDLEGIFGMGGKVGLVKSNSKRRLNSGMTLADRCDIGLDLATCFTLSDQIPTSILIDVKTEPWCVRGWMIQALPNMSYNEFETLRPQLESSYVHEHFSKLESLEPFYVEELFKGLGLMEQNHKLHVHETLTPESFCECNLDKIKFVLHSLPLNELEDMIKVDGGAQVDCQFCNQAYRFEAHDLRIIIDQKIKPKHD